MGLTQGAVLGYLPSLRKSEKFSEVIAYYAARPGHMMLENYSIKREIVICYEKLGEIKLAAQVASSLLDEDAAAKTYQALIRYSESCSKILKIINQIDDQNLPLKWKSDDRPERIANKQGGWRKFLVMPISYSLPQVMMLGHINQLGNLCGGLFDIGCGMGFFVFAASRFFSFDVSGCEIELENNIWFKKCWEELGVEDLISEYRVPKSGPLLLPPRTQYVVAHLPTFNLGWDLSEYLGFVSELSKHQSVERLLLFPNPLNAKQEKINFRQFLARGSYCSDTNIATWHMNKFR